MKTIVFKLALYAVIKIIGFLLCLYALLTIADFYHAFRLFITGSLLHRIPAIFDSILNALYLIGYSHEINDDENNLNPQ